MNSLSAVANVLEQVAVHGSRITKEQILKQNAELQYLKPVLKFIYDPYIRTGISTAKLKKKVGSLSGLHEDVTVLDVIQYFTDNQTGSDASIWYGQNFIDSQDTPEAKKLALAMVTKDLKIGVTATTLNKLYGDSFIPKTGIMRGVHYSDFKHKVKGPFIVTEKIDGGRRILFKENGNITVYTRSGHIDEGLVDLENEAQYLPDNKVYDIEAAAIGDFKSGIELRQATNSILARKGERTGLYFNVFDMLPVSQFKAGKSLDNALTRKVLLAALFKDWTSVAKLNVDPTNFMMFAMTPILQFIRPLPILGLVHTEEEIMSLAQPIWDQHFEGVMLNTVGGYYEVSESPRQQLLKVKANEEAVLTCTGMFEGKGRLVGTLGGIVLDYKGFGVECGSGFNDAQRKLYWENSSLILDKKIEIEHFGESKNKQGGTSLNCPIFKRVKGEIE